VLAEPGQHSLKITPVDRSFGGFLMGKVTVNGQPASANQIVL